jgi:hypothetical protein
MFKIILKSADDLMELKSFSGLDEAVAYWRKLRADHRYTGQVISLQATYGPQIFLRHDFHAEPGEMYFVPLDADLENLFIAGAADA